MGYKTFFDLFPLCKALSPQCFHFYFSTPLFKEKENRVEPRQSARSTTIKEEEFSSRMYQKSLARRVPMIDPLRETNGVYEPIPDNIKKVKLVISSRKRKLPSNILEPITQLKEVDSNSLESGSSKGAFGRSKKRKKKEVAAALPTASTRYRMMFLSKTENKFNMTLLTFIP